MVTMRMAMVEEVVNCQGERRLASASVPRWEAAFSSDCSRGSVYLEDESTEERSRSRLAVTAYQRSVLEPEPAREKAQRQVWHIKTIA